MTLLLTKLMLCVFDVLLLLHICLCIINRIYSYKTNNIGIFIFVIYLFNYRQDGNTGDMIFNIPTLISYISNYFTLEEGDLILTGTPSGVGPVKDGDEITGEIPNLKKFKFSVVKRT